MKLTESRAIEQGICCISCGEMVNVHCCENCGETFENDEIVYCKRNSGEDCEHYHEDCKAKEGKDEKIQI